jgi:hypothetical protein
MKVQDQLECISTNRATREDCKLAIFSEIIKSDFYNPKGQINAGSDRSCRSWDFMMPIVLSWTTHHQQATIGQ